MTKRVGIPLGMLITWIVLASAGCADQERSTFDLRTPRMYVWTRFDPAELRNSLRADGLVIEENNESGGLFIIHGTGTLKWPSVEIVLAEDRIVVNGVRLDSRPDSYRNLIVEKNGRVQPDAFLPFEW